MTDTEDRTLPECFARLDKVFPLKADGLRQSPPGCLACHVKTDCLRSAVSGEQGSPVREERLARAYRAGAVGFCSRWAQQKEIVRCKQRRRSWLEVFKRIRDTEP
jgi:hypothetical protein